MTRTEDDARMTGELRECDGCEHGQVEREAEDYAPDSGVSYKPINGSSFDSLTRDWLCVFCSTTAPGDEQ